MGRALGAEATAGTLWQADDVLGQIAEQQIESRLGSDWSVWAFNSQGRGHACLKVQIQHRAWAGTPMVGRWRSGNHEVHLELDLRGDKSWPLMIHCETNPYAPSDQLKKLDGTAGFWTFSDAFREGVHHRSGDLPGWRMRRNTWLAATMNLPLSWDSTVHDFVEVVAKAAAQARPTVSAALQEALERAKGGPSRRPVGGT